VIAGLPLPAEGIEDETVGAEALLRHPVLAVVVLVALLHVLKVAVGLGASERGLSCKGKVQDCLTLSYWCGMITLLKVIFLESKLFFL